MHHNVETKCSRMDENSFILWHKRLGHISKQKKLERLVKDKILLNLDLTDLGMCVNCIKRKQIKHTKKGTIRSVELLEIIHTGILWTF